MRRKCVPPVLVKELISQNFKRKDIAKLLCVSRNTLERTMKKENIKIRDSYTQISDYDLQSVVLNILEEHPNTGMKVMNGFLRAQGIRVTFICVQEAVRQVDPIGVQCRKSNSRVIVRRVYFVKYSNQIWHMDSCLKLTNWKFVIQGAVYGNSRLCTYLNVADNNTSLSTLNSFLRGVEEYGVSSRTRSDKGGENRGVVEFMLRNRGENRASHICGRSVHNQRIERFWVDVQAKVLLQYILLFTTMENRRYLDTGNELHMCILHYVFLPRIQMHLSSFQLGWNHHSLSTSANRTPNQLFLLHKPPPETDLCLPQEIHDTALFAANTYTDLQQFNESSSLTNPVPPRYNFSEQEMQIIREVNPLRLSTSYGLDIYLDCLNRLHYQNVVGTYRR